MNTIRSSILLVAAVASLSGVSLVTSTTSAEARFERIKSFASRGASFALRGAAFAHRAVRPGFGAASHSRPRPIIAQTPNGPIKVPCDFNCVRPKPPVVVVQRPPVVVVQRPPHVHLPQRPIVVAGPTYVAPAAYAARAAYAPAPLAPYVPPAPAYAAPAAYAPPAPAAAPTADNCIVKQYTQDGQAMFIDKCTNETAMAAPAPVASASTAGGPESEEDADPQIRRQ